MLLIGLPVLLMLTAATAIHFLNHTNGAIVSSGEKRECLVYEQGCVNYSLR